MSPPPGPEAVCFNHAAPNSSSVVQPVQLMDVSDYQQQYMTTSRCLKRPCPGGGDPSDHAAAGDGDCFKPGGLAANMNSINSKGSVFSVPAAPETALHTSQSAQAFISMGSLGPLTLQAEAEGVLLPPPLAIPEAIPNLSNTSNSMHSCNFTSSAGNNSFPSSSLLPSAAAATPFPSLAEAAKHACNQLHSGSAGTEALASVQEHEHVPAAAKRVTFREAIKPVKDGAAKSLASLEALQKSLLQKAPPSFILTCQEQQYTGAPSIDGTAWWEDDDGHDEMMEGGCMLGLPAAMCCYPYTSSWPVAAAPAAGASGSMGVKSTKESGSGCLGGGDSSGVLGEEQKQAGAVEPAQAAASAAAAGAAAGEIEVRDGGIDQDTAAPMEVDDEPEAGHVGLDGLAPAAAAPATAANEDDGRAGGSAWENVNSR